MCKIVGEIINDTHLLYRGRGWRMRATLDSVIGRNIPERAVSWRGPEGNKGGSSRALRKIAHSVSEKQKIDQCNCEEGRTLKNWCFWTAVLEKTLEGPLDCKEIQPVHSEGDQPWDSFGRNDAKAEAPVLQTPHAKSWLIGKDSDAGRDWGQEEKGTTQDEMAGWHHELDGRESEWTPGDGDGQGGLVCCD